MVRYFFKTVIYISEKIINVFSKPVPFHEKNDYTITKDLEENYNELKKEFLNIKGKLKNFEKISREQAKLINFTGAWKTTIFKAGKTFLRNVDNCPLLKSILIKYPDVVYAMISVLEPGAKLTPHKGTYGGVLRIHLGIEIPQGDVFLSVDNIKKYWENGKVLVFDDKFMHYAENNTLNSRVVLFIDIVKPLPYIINLYNRCIIKLIECSPFIKRMIENSTD